MLRKLFLIATLGTLVAGVPKAANAQADTVGPFLQPFQERCAAVGLTPEGTDEIIWAISTNPREACDSAYQQTLNSGYRFRGFYEIPSELSNMGWPIAVPRTQPSYGGICFSQPGETCY
jgi:hypothetical protein